MTQILASLKDINAQLPSLDDNAVIEATDENTYLIQISVARVIRAYLARSVNQTMLMSWVDPDHTPDIIREVAARLIAAGLYANFAARTSMNIEDHSFGQKKYDEAMKILQGILTGDIVLAEFDIQAVDSLSALDFFPVDDTDRAFTRSMEL